MSADAVEPGQGCPVCDGSPRVLIGVRHAVMRRFAVELVRREHRCWVATEPEEGELLADAIRRLDPDVLVVDDGDFPACCRAAIAAFPRARVVVVGTEPDDAYEAAAFRAGAGAWVPRERVGEALGTVMREVLGCRHAPCPPGDDRAEAAAASGSTAS